MIKYKFACNVEGQIIDIQSLSKHNQSKHTFKCLSCDQEMIPILGSKRVNHFRHKVITNINCSPETYLHKLGKRKFYEIYENCLKNNKPFKIKITMNKICNFYEKDFSQICELPPEKKEFDLTKYFKNLYLECKRESFIPDILLESDNQEAIFFEVAVTHLSSQKKVNSNNRIIEFMIDCEEDIKIIESCLLEESEKIKFLNFKNIIIQNFCKGNCYKGMYPYAQETLFYNIFVVYRNGKSEFSQKQLNEINLLINRGDIVYYQYIDNIQDKEISSFYKQKLIEAYQNGIDIKDCFFCGYHSVNPYSWHRGTPIFCKLLKKTCSSHVAKNCQYFQSNLNV